MKRDEFSQEIFLIEVHIAGTTHIENINVLEPKLAEGMEVQFYREPNNQYLSRLMDAGKLLYGKVKTKKKIGDWVKIEMEVYLKD